MEERRGGQMLGSPGAFPTDQRGARKGRALGNSGAISPDGRGARREWPLSVAVPEPLHDCSCGRAMRMWLTVLPAPGSRGRSNGP